MNVIESDDNIIADIKSPVVGSITYGNNENNNTKSLPNSDEPTQTEELKKKHTKKRKVQIPAKEYEDMTQILALHIKKIVSNLFR